MPKLKEILFGKKTKTKQLKTQSPMQEELSKLINESLTKGTGAFSDLYGSFDEEKFNKGVRDPALKNFQENILPSIQEKYLGNDSFGGSGQERAKRKAGVDLQSRLAELLYGAQQGQLANQQRGVETALNVRPYENAVKQGSAGIIPSAVKGIAEKGTAAIGNYIAG